MIPFYTTIDFAHNLMSRFRESVMEKNVFVERLDNSDYAVYNHEHKRILWLQFATKQEIHNGPYNRFLQAIETQYTTHLACCFNPDDVNSLVSAVEDVYKKQQETECNRKKINEENLQKAIELCHRINKIKTQEFITRQ